MFFFSIDLNVSLSTFFLILSEMVIQLSPVLSSTFFSLWLMARLKKARFSCHWYQVYTLLFQQVLYIVVKKRNISAYLISFAISFLLFYSNARLSFIVRARNNITYTHTSNITYSMPWPISQIATTLHIINWVITWGRTNLRRFLLYIDRNVFGENSFKDDIIVRYYDWEPSLYFLSVYQLKWNQWHRMLYIAQRFLRQHKYVVCIRTNTCNQKHKKSS